MDKTVLIFKLSKLDGINSQTGMEMPTDNKDDKELRRKVEVWIKQ